MCQLCVCLPCLPRHDMTKSYHGELFLTSLPIVEGLPRWRGHQCGVWLFSLLVARISSGKNNGVAGDLNQWFYVTVMIARIYLEIVHICNLYHQCLWKIIMRAAGKYIHNRIANILHRLQIYKEFSASAVNKYKFSILWVKFYRIFT